MLFKHLGKWVIPLNQMSHTIIKWKGGREKFVFLTVISVFENEDGKTLGFSMLIKEKGNC